MGRRTSIGAVSLAMLAVAGGCGTTPSRAGSQREQSRAAELTVDDGDDGAGGERALTAEELKMLLDALEEEIRRADER